MLATTTRSEVTCRTTRSGSWGSVVGLTLVDGDALGDALGETVGLSQSNGPAVSVLFVSSVSSTPPVESTTAVSDPCLHPNANSAISPGCSPASTMNALPPTETTNRPDACVPTFRTATRLPFSSVTTRSTPATALGLADALADGLGEPGPGEGVVTTVPPPSLRVARKTP